MQAHYRDFFYRHNYFDIGSSLVQANDEPTAHIQGSVSSVCVTSADDNRSCHGERSLA